ncbi:response regulator transcription factor [Pelagibacterium limicola]|uniref:response regulator transcription factor n=1 Tax=Pelagibacterium limicola TaxID=2791022 RepID=UPI0018AFE604|nr:response regulator transcription factor [Pelagibacterium limicola]
MRALIVEDDIRISATVTSALGEAEFSVRQVANGEQAWPVAMEENFDIIVLDLGLPGLDGMTLLRQWRASGMSTPIIVLTARSHWAERVDGIEAGADDYLVKPFRSEELLARIKAILRRTAEPSRTRIEIGDLVLQTQGKEVRRNGDLVPMPPFEYRLLAYLAQKAGKVVSQSELSEYLHDTKSPRDFNSIERLVARVRKRLGPEIIKTQRGFGYYVEERPR